MGGKKNTTAQHPAVKRGQLQSKMILQWIYSKENNVQLAIKGTGCRKIRYLAYERFFLVDSYFQAHCLNLCVQVKMVSERLQYQNVKRNCKTEECAYTSSVCTPPSANDSEDSER